MAVNLGTMLKRPATRVSADDLAANALIEQMVAAWHASLMAKYGLRPGDQFNRQTGAITRVAGGA